MTAKKRKPSGDYLAEWHIEFKKEIQETVKATIETTVNGKIKNIDQKLDDYITIDTQWKKEDKAWKDTAQPSVNLGLSTINWWNAMRWILLTGASLAGFILAIKTITGLFK